jgi:hypothetical protein
LSSDIAEPFLHPDKPEPSATVSHLELCRNLETTSIILDNRLHVFLGAAKDNADVPRAGVLRDVVKRFLDNSVKRRFGF